MRNIIDSIQNRLRNYSKAHNKIHQFTLIRYFQERLLYRLSKSRYRNQFLLKGGALIYSIQKESSRPTLDIDLLAKELQADSEELKRIFLEIIEIEFNDGIIYDPESITTSEIIKEGNYSGIRVKVIARLGKIKQSMQIDIGFGDIVTPGPIEMEYPTIIEMESPKLLAYSIESMVSEKFQAMIDLAEYNSRMKDFYDVYTILKLRNYDENILQTAIRNTFERRNTKYVEDHTLFDDAFYEDTIRVNQWKVFLKKAKLDTKVEFSEVMKEIRNELKQMYEKMK